MGSGNGKAPRARNRTVVLTPELAGKVRARVSTAPQKFGDITNEEAPRQSSNSNVNGPVGGGFGQGTAQRPGARPNFAAPPPSGAGFSSPPPAFGRRESSPPISEVSAFAESSGQMQGLNSSERINPSPLGSRTVMAPPPPESYGGDRATGGHIPKPTPWGDDSDEHDSGLSRGESSFEQSALSAKSNMEVEVPEQRWSTPPPPPPGLSGSEFGEAFSDDDDLPLQSGQTGRPSLELPTGDLEKSAGAFFEAGSGEDVELSGLAAEGEQQEVASVASSISQHVETEVDELEATGNSRRVPESGYTQESQELARQSVQHESPQSSPPSVPVNPMEELLPNLTRRPGGTAPSDAEEPRSDVQVVVGAKSAEQPGGKLVGPAMLLGFMVSFDTDPYGEAFELREGRTIVSSDLPRSGGRVVLIDDPSVASMHAVIKADADKIILLDQLSECSTVVIRQGQEDLELSGDREDLVNGDIVKFGDRSFKICLVS